MAWLCKRGHDKDVVGVHDRSCRECQRLLHLTSQYRKAQRLRQRTPKYREGERRRRRTPARREYMRRWCQSVNGWRIVSNRRRQSRYREARRAVVQRYRNRQKMQGAGYSV